MNKLVYTILFSLTLFSCAQFQPDADKDRIDAVCNKFMQALTVGKIANAMMALKQNSVIDPSSIDTLQKTTTEQMKTLIGAYGKIYSYEFVAEHKVKNVIVKRYYMLKFQRYYLKFDFTLYNNGYSWTITNFEYNYELTDLL